MLVISRHFDKEAIITYKVERILATKFLLPRGKHIKWLCNPSLEKCQSLQQAAISVSIQEPDPCDRMRRQALAHREICRHGKAFSLPQLCLAACLRGSGREERGSCRPRAATPQSSFAFATWTPSKFK